MDRIVFEFHGGPHHGQRIEGGANRSWSAIKQDVVLRYWFLTRCGSLGERLELDGTTYEVTGRVYQEDSITVQFRWASATRSGVSPGAEATVYAQSTASSKEVAAR